MSVSLGRGGKGSPYGAAAGVRGNTTAHPPPSEHSPGLSTWFSRAASATANMVGTPWAFLLAASIILVWALTGPLFGFSDTWQLVINTGTTIVTFLMVFLIQNTQNRDAKALHLKLDELLRAMDSARNELIDVEEETDENLSHIQQAYRQLREEAPPTGTPPLPVEPPAAAKQPPAA